MKYSLLVLAVVLFGCSSTTVQSENGKHSIQCLNVVARCHEKARSICSDGYLVANRVRPQKLGDDTQYTINIKCRNPVMY